MMTMEKYIEAVIKAEAEHLEMMACAFIRQVGVGNVLDYELVRKQDGIVTRIYFQKKEKREA